MIKTNINRLEQQFQAYRVADIERSYEKLLKIEDDLREARRIPADELSERYLRELDTLICELQGCAIQAQDLQRELKRKMVR